MLKMTDAFFQALNAPKLVFTPSHTLHPRRLRRLDLGAFGASVVRPPTQISRYTPVTHGAPRNK